MNSSGAAILDETLLEGIRSRAAEYDRRNEFPIADLDDLKAVGYLKAFVPRDLGGLGLGMLDVTREQRRLAAAAPATALAINMHLTWTGVAAAMLARGDDSLAYVLTEAAAGEIFAFGISEPGNDLVLFWSTTDARPQPHGGYAFTGTKIFTSLSPVWTRLGVFGLDSESQDAPKLVHAFLDRDTAGITIANDWDTIGMRASQSNSTQLEDARAPAERVFGRRDPGPNSESLVFAILANFEVLLSAVYVGIGERALQLAVESAARRRGIRSGIAADQIPETRWKIADAAIELDGIIPQLDTIARDVDGLVDHGEQWFRKLTGLKLRATRSARFIVDRAIRVSGGSMYFATSELGRLYRDVLAGEFHPGNEDSVHQTVAIALLGPIKQSPEETE